MIIVIRHCLLFTITSHSAHGSLSTPSFINANYCKFGNLDPNPTARYRALVRLALASGRRFGMVGSLAPRKILVNTGYLVNNNGEPD